MEKKRSPVAASAGRAMEQDILLEERLLERDAQLRLAEQSAGVGVWDIDIPTDTVRGTIQFFRIMGLEPTSEAVPMDVLRSLRLPEDRERVNNDYAAASRDRDTCDTEYRIRRPDGEVRWIFGRGRIVRDRRGDPVRYSGVDMDITDRKATEFALAESETRLRLAVEAGQIGIWDWNVLTNEMMWSARAKEIASFPPDEPVSLDQVRAVTHPEDLPRTWAMAQRALDPMMRSSEPYEYRLVRPDGDLRWVLAHGEAHFAMIDGLERAVRYTGTIQDITDRKQAERNFLASEARLRLAVEAARQAVWEFDLSKQQLLGSPELNRLLGYAEERILNVEEIRRRYLPGEEEKIREAGQKALAEGQRFFQTEYRYLRPDDEVRWFLLRAEILLSENGEPSGVRGVLMDITETKALEEHRELMHAELLHRIKNVIALIGAIANQTFAKESLAAREAFSARIGALANANSILSRQAWQSANFSEVIDFALAPHRAGAGRFELSGPEVRLNARQAVTLALALNELATNATKYGALSAPTGRISVKWGIEEGEDPVFFFHWTEQGGPPVAVPTRSGFGSRLIEQSFPSDFGGVGKMDYRTTGIIFTVRAPWPIKA